MVEWLFLACAPKVLEPPPPPDAPWAEHLRLASVGALPTEACTGHLSVPPPPEHPPEAPPLPDMSSWQHLQIATAKPPGPLPSVPLSGSPSDIEALATTLAGASHKRVRLGFWGDSHTSPDTWLQALRESFSEKYGDAGHGLVYPVAPWIRYEPKGVTTCTNGAWKTVGANPASPQWVGLGFFAVEGGETDAYGWVEGEGSRWELLYVSQPNGGGMVVSIDDTVMQRSTQGEWGPQALVLDLPPGRHRLSVRLSGDGPVRLVGLNLETGKSGVIVDNLGRGGMPFSLWLKGDMQKFSEWVGRRPYEVAVLEYGSNDGKVADFEAEKFRETLRGALGQFRKLLPTAACLVIGPGDRGYRLSPSDYVVWNTHTTINTIIREETPAFHCASWDMQAAMGGPGSALLWWKGGGMGADYTHLTEAGYQQIASKLMEALRLPQKP